MLGWPADSDAFFNKYNGAVLAHGRLPSGFARELQEWRTRGAKAGTVYATCAPSHNSNMCTVGQPQPLAHTTAAAYATAHRWAEVEAAFDGFGPYKVV